MGYILSYRLYIGKSGNPQPETLTLTLIQVPYYGSLSWVSISIEKWVINRVMGYKLGNGGNPPTETLNMIPTNRDPPPETPTIYPQRGSLL
jgi:hypothetical protein